MNKFDTLYNNIIKEYVQYDPTYKLSNYIKELITIQLPKTNIINPQAIERFQEIKGFVLNNMTTQPDRYRRMQVRKLVVFILKQMKMLQHDKTYQLGNNEEIISNFNIEQGLVQDVHKWFLQNCIKLVKNPIKPGFKKNTFMLNEKGIEYLNCQDTTLKNAQWTFFPYIAEFDVGNIAGSNIIAGQTQLVAIAYKWLNKGISKIQIDNVDETNVNLLKVKLNQQTPQELQYNAYIVNNHGTFKIVIPKYLNNRRKYRK